MSYRLKTIAAAAFALAALAPMSFANAADLPVKAKAKPVADLPFFLLIDDRVSFSYQFTATDPGVFTRNANGTLNSTTAKQVYTFTHFDVWAYGTNFFNIEMLKSDHNDPATGCNFPGTGCAGATEFYGLFRSTFGWNEIFNTKAFSMGPLHNISFEIGADGETENNPLAPAKRDFVAGLQFAFDLPYKGFFNVTPLAYKEINHNSFTQCAAGGIVGVTCTVDGNTDYNTTWAVETNYYMDLGFLPEGMQFFSVSGRAAWYGKKGYENAPLPGAPGGGGTPTAIEFNGEPIRLTFDASKAIWGPKYSHNVDLWVGYRYWQNKFGLDHANSLVCNVLVGGTLRSNNSCTKSSVYSGVTVKF